MKENNMVSQEFLNNDFMREMKFARELSMNH